MLEHFIEVFFSIGMFVNAVLFIPQAIRLYQKKNSEDVSLITFAGFNAINFFTVLHGVLRHDLLLMIGYTLSFSTNSAVTILTIWYRIQQRKERLAHV